MLSGRITPWIVNEGSRLIIKNDRWLQVICLFTNLKTVEIQPYSKKIIHRVRRLWLFHTEHIIRFSEVAYLDFKGTARVVTEHREGGSNRQRQIDVMQLAVVTTSGERHVLCDYVGGDAAAESRRTAECCSEVMEKPIGRYGTVEDTKTTCPSCGKETSAKRAKCPFCGSELARDG